MNIHGEFTVRQRQSRLTEDRSLSPHSWMSCANLRVSNRNSQPPTTRRQMEIQRFSFNTPINASAPSSITSRTIGQTCSLLWTSPKPYCLMNPHALPLTNSSSATSHTSTLTGTTAPRNLPHLENNSLVRRHSSLPNELMMQSNMCERTSRRPNNVKANRPISTAENQTSELEISSTFPAKAGPPTGPARNSTTNVLARSRSWKCEGTPMS